MSENVNQKINKHLQFITYFEKKPRIISNAVHRNFYIKYYKKLKVQCLFITLPPSERTRLVNKHGAERNGFDEILRVLTSISPASFHTYIHRRSMVILKGHSFRTVGIEPNNHKRPKQVLKCFYHTSNISTLKQALCQYYLYTTRCFQQNQSRFQETTYLKQTRNHN